MAGPGPGPLCPPFLSPSMLRLTPDVTPDVCHRPDSVVTVCRAPRPGVDWLSLEALRQRWPGLGPPVEMSSSLFSGPRPLPPRSPFPNLQSLLTIHHIIIPSYHQPHTLYTGHHQDIISIHRTLSLLPSSKVVHVLMTAFPVLKWIR